MNKKRRITNLASLSILILTFSNLHSMLEDDFSKLFLGKREIIGIHGEVDISVLAGIIRRNQSIKTQPTHLDLSEIKIQDENLLKLIQRFRNTESIDLGDNSPITNIGIKHIIENCPRLHTLRIGNFSNITAEGIRDIAQQKHHINFNLHLFGCKHDIQFIQLHQDFPNFNIVFDCESNSATIGKYSRKQ